jgi:hypothetical protein
MNFNAIRLVSEALKKTLESAFDAAGISGSVYIGPLDDQDAQAAAAVLFLYRLVPNADLRSAEHRVAAADPLQPAIVHRGALPLDLYYLLTAGTSETGGEVKSLSVLGCAMQRLNDQPQLVGVDVEGDTIRVTFEPVGSEEMSRIWTLFPAVNFRTSVVYVVSPVWIDPAIARTDGPPVVREPHRFGQFEKGAA